MIASVTETRSRGPWHLLPPVASVVLGLLGGLYVITGALLVEWVCAYATAGPYPALIWTEVVGFPFLIGALHLAAGIGIWRARVRARAAGPSMAARRRWSPVATVGLALLGAAWCAAALVAVVLLQRESSPNPYVPRLATWSRVVGAPLAIGGLHLAVAWGLRRDRWWARIAAGAVAIGYLSLAFPINLIMIGLTESYYKAGTFRAGDVAFEASFMAVATLVTAACALILYALHRDT